MLKVVGANCDIPWLWVKCIFIDFIHFVWLIKIDSYPACRLREKFGVVPSGDIGPSVLTTLHRTWPLFTLEEFSTIMLNALLATPVVADGVRSSAFEIKFWVEDAAVGTCLEEAGGSHSVDAAPRWILRFTFNLQYVVLLGINVL